MNYVRLSDLTNRLQSLESSDTGTLTHVRSEIVDLKQMLEESLHCEMADFLGAADAMVRSIGSLEDESFLQVRELVVTLLKIVGEMVKNEGLAASTPTVGELGKLELTQAPTHSDAPADSKEDRPPLTLENEIMNLTYQGVNTMSELLLGQILLEDDKLTRPQLVEALKLHTRERVLIGEAMVRLGFVSKEDVEQAFQKQDKLVRALNSETHRSKAALIQDLSIGEILVRIGGLEQADIDRALQVHRASGKRLGEALVELGLTTWDRVEEACRIQAKNRMSSAWGLPEAKGLSLRLEE